MRTLLRAVASRLGSRWIPGTLLAVLALATACSQDGPTSPPPPDPVGTAPSAVVVEVARGSLTNGANHTGSISAAGQTDSWTLAASQGNLLVLTIGEVTGTTAFTPWIRLVAPGGAVIGNSWGALAAQIQVSAPATGTYTVIVGTADAARAATGSYRLTLLRSPGTFVVSTGDQGGAMTNGANHSGSIVVGDLDPWTFSAAQGDAIILSVGEVTGTSAFTPWIRLVAPNGTVLGNAWGAAAAQVQVAAPATGTYAVIVGTADAGRSATGSYRLILAKAPGTFVVPTGDHGGAMTNGSTHTGSIAVGDLDLWRLTASQGNTLVVGVGEISGVAAFTPWIRLVAPNGAIVGNAWGAAAAQIQVSAPVTGSYTIVVATADAGRSATGSYRLIAVKAPGTLVISPGDEGGPMTNGATHSGSLLAGGLDPWTFSASQGNTFVVSVGEVTGSTAFTPWIRVVAPSGAIVGNSWGAAAAQIQVRAPATGTYTVIVATADAGRSATGSYRLTLVRAPGTFVVSTGDQGGALTTGATSAGNIVVGDVDPWTLAATQGTVITLSITEVTGTTAFTPWIRLVAPSGAIVGNSWGAAGAQITTTAPATGTYTVIVGTADAGRSATGSYQLRRS